MRRRLAAFIVGVAIGVAGLSPAAAQVAPPPVVVPPGSRGLPPPPSLITPLGWYAMGGIACAAISPMIGTVVLGREMTAAEVGRSTLNCFLGPIGWIIGPSLFPDVPAAANTPPIRTPPPRSAPPSRGGRNISIPPPGETRFVPNEVLVEIASGVSQRTLDTIMRRLRLTQLETQTFTLTGRTLARFRIGGNRSVPTTLRALARYRGVAAAQPNWLYGLTQAQPATADTGAQYVVGKLHLLEAHRISNGDDVTVALIDSRVDTAHPDLAGVVAEQYDAVGGVSAPHPHGTAMAGAIAAHAKLIGVAPKVRLLAVRAFAGEGDSAKGTTFSILKALDWAASKNARIVNMSFAGPSDAMLHDMIDKAYARGMVLIAAVGNAGPKSPPLYPAADRDVIGVTATDADDRLLPQANRGPQVAVAAPGVDILAAAPGGQYDMTSGTSVATAHVTGVAALLLARDPKLTPGALRRLLVGSARKVSGAPRDVGAGVVDALKAVEETGH
jgi:subtilisin family serine protease